MVAGIAGKIFCNFSWIRAFLYPIVSIQGMWLWFYIPVIVSLYNYVFQFSVFRYAESRLLKEDVMSRFSM